MGGCRLLRPMRSTSTRSIVMQVDLAIAETRGVTESQSPSTPIWRKRSKSGVSIRSTGPRKSVFASPESQGRRPYWGQSIMRNVIRPTACRLGINKRIG